MENILEIKNLRKNFKDFSLKDVSFFLPRGFIMGFIGPNGAGKSTTIKLIMNLLKKDSGEIKVFGLDNIKNEIEIKDRIGFVFDENLFYEELTALEIKKIIKPLYKRWDEDSFLKYIKDFNLPLNKKIKDFSKGMKMKLSLSVALSHNAEMLIMDEPTSGLDPIVRSELLDILSYIIQDENKGVLFSTHITSDLEKIADYITFINNGEILFSVEKDIIMDNYGMVKGDKEILREDIKKEFVGIKYSSFGFEGLVKDKKVIKNALKEKIIIEKPSLDDIMLYYLRREIHA
ncbi:ABC-2 type transport system ATP-binding protein [Caloramator quimbayensis]|uniref:ABC-2 type transport system ATP-binding protein n=1 Tax=Caloramator quimbayensis TaxID=1147123 RepID=A0A1T4WLD3_9CLOT|nr:ABC transporter ATP-binding protein [Caloramator quimbayensis]SKA78166.1 ABC-2 type transport system ATP-binding protein [Caloramator quimbayensis]